jgi:hypothetical protein
MQRLIRSVNYENHARMESFSWIVPFCEPSNTNARTAFLQAAKSSSAKTEKVYNSISA